MTWFRFYVEALDDPKVQRLPAKTFKNWVNLLCLAKRFDGTLPPLKDIAFALRTTQENAEAIIQNLCKLNLLDQSEDGFEPHNWAGRQYKSDVSTDRVKRFRKRHETLHETPPEQSRTETEQSRGGNVPKSANGKGSRISPDWFAAEKDIKWAEKNVPKIDCEKEQGQFVDHWLQQTGTKAVKRDWDAAFRNWLRNAEKFRLRDNPTPGYPRSSGAAI